MIVKIISAVMQATWLDESKDLLMISLLLECILINLSASLRYKSLMSTLMPWREWKREFRLTGPSLVVRDQVFDVSESPVLAAL